MSKQVTLSPDDGTQLRQILELLEMDQKTLSEKADVSRAWLSGVLKADVTKTVDAEMFVRVTGIVDDFFRKLPTPLMNSDLGQMASNFLDRFLTQLGDAADDTVYAPGGPVPIGARHYVEPPEFEKAFAGLQKKAFTMILRGPAQCGKSSLIARIKQKADAIGVQTLMFDPLSRTVRQDDDPTSWTTIALSEQLQAEWGLEPPKEGPATSLAKLGRWVQEALAATASKPRLLIVDDLASLGPDEAANWLRIFVRKMHNDRAFPPYVRLSVLLGVTHLYGPEFERVLLKMSSVVHWAPRVELTWLEPEKAKHIVETVSEEPVDAQAIFELVRGQPYLTHAAAMNRDFRVALDDWSKSRSDKSADQLMRMAVFRRHLTSIKLGILGQQLEPNGESKALLNSFIKSCSGESIDPDHKAFLQKVRLLNSEGKPELKMYELFARDFKSLI
jgi:hypothetical protein